MPRLPDALGTPDQLAVVPPDPSRIIPHYEAGQVGTAMQGFGGDLGQSANQIQDVQDRLARAAAEQDFISKKLDLDQQFASDPDYSTAPQRYRQSLLQALNDTSQTIAGPLQRALFQQQMSRFTEAGVDSMLRQSMGRARDAGRATVTEAGGAAVTDGLRAKDDADLTQVINAYNDRVQASLEAGYLSPEEAAALRKNTARSYVSARGWQLVDADPQQAIDTLKPSGTDAEGEPVFARSNAWPDLIDPGERVQMVQRAQQNLETQQRAAGIEALRQQRQQQKAESDAAQAIAARYVSQLATDPTGVDIGALARENFRESQRPMQQALIGAAEGAIAGAGGPASYGPDFWHAFNRVTAADGDPGKINDPAELLKLASPEGGGALTIQGVRELQRYLDTTVEGRAQNAMEQMFLRQAHAAITGTEAPADAAGETQFQNFLGAYFPALDQGLNSGKSATQLLSAASADYLGNLIPAFTPPPAQPVADQPAQNAPAAPVTDQPNATTAIGQELDPNLNRQGDNATGAPTSAHPPWDMTLEGAKKYYPPLERYLQGYSNGTPLTRMLDATIEAAKQGLTTPAVISPEEFQKAREFYGERMAELFGPVAAWSEAFGRGWNALVGGGFAAFKQTLKEGGFSEEAAQTAVNMLTDPGLQATLMMPGPPRPPTPLSLLPEARVKDLRATVPLPTYDGPTSGTALTNEGQTIELKSGSPDPRFSLPASKHAEGKAAIWIRDNNSSGGIVFHNNPDGTCMICDRNIPTLLPEGARLWVVPPADAVAPDETWIDYPKQYTGNSAQPKPPKAQE